MYQLLNKIYYQFIKSLEYTRRISSRIKNCVKRKILYIKTTYVDSFRDQTTITFKLQAFSNLKKDIKYNQFSLSHIVDIIQLFVDLQQRWQQSI